MMKVFERLPGYEKKMNFVFVFIFIVILLGDLHLAKMPKESTEKNYEKAREIFKKAQETENLKEKESFYKDALKLCPGYPEAHNNLGDVYEKLGRYNEAIKEYKIASSLSPNAPYPYFGLGDVYFKLGNFEIAINYYEKGLKIKANDTLSGERLKLSKILNTKIFFPFDSYELTDKEVKKLEMIVEALSSTELVGCRFEIQGHTDSIGPEDYNIYLSLKRARMVKKYLVDKANLAEERLTVKGYGEDRPIASNGTRDGRKLNRRVILRRR